MFLFHPSNVGECDVILLLRQYESYRYCVNYPKKEKSTVESGILGTGTSYSSSSNILKIK